MNSADDSSAAQFQTGLSEQKEVIVLIPRFAVELLNDTRDGLLVPGLLSQGTRLALADSPSDFRRIEYGSRKIDLCEVFWRDLTDELGKDNPGKQVLRSLGLFGYWRQIKLKALLHEKSLAYSLLITLALLLLWYISTLYTAWNLLPKDVRTPLADNAVKIGKALTQGIHVGHLAPPHWLNTFGSFLQSSVAWAIFSLILVKLGVPTLVNTSDFVRRYLTNINLPEQKKAEPSSHTVPASGPLDGSTQPLVLRIHLRLAEKLADLHKKGYARITVLAHSMGCLPAVRLFADTTLLPLLPATRIRLITMGGTLQFLNMRDEQVKRMALLSYDNLIRLNDREKGNGEEIVWYDFFSTTDWLSSNSPILNDDEHTRFFGKELTQLPKGWNQQTSGVTHSSYFMNEEVLKTLLEE